MRSSPPMPRRTSPGACTATSSGTSPTCRSGSPRGRARRGCTATSSTPRRRRSPPSTRTRTCSPARPRPPADPTAQLLVGALAPRAQPLAFLRQLGCVDARYRRIRTGACAHFKPVTATALAFHPHSITYAPWQPFVGRDDANLASLGRLEAVLDRLRRAGRLRVGGGLWLDEYG